MRSRVLCFFVLLAVVVMSSYTAEKYTAEQYIDDVLTGKQVVCKYVRLAVERHVNDLKRAEKDDPTFSYYFDKKQAKRVIDFKQQLRHVEGKWANPRNNDTRIKLEPWQQFKDWVLFGWRRRSDDCRRFTKAYITMARKQGKTTDAAGTANYCYLADRPREYGPQIYCIGPKKAQGLISWKYAKLQIEKHPALRKRTKTYKQNNVIVRLDDPAAIMTVWGKDAEMQDGFNPSFALIDEAHLYPGNESMEIVESGMGAREQPLTYIITTAGTDINSPVHQEEHQLAIQTLERTIDPVPENYFCLIFTLDEGDDWLDESVWLKANPNLGVSVSWDYLRDRAQAAMQMPSKQNLIITKNFNIWTQAETRWLTDDVWMKCGGKVYESKLYGRKCFLGIDLAATQDITALAFCFPPVGEETRFQFFYRFFIPEENVIERERRDKVPYTYWLKKGLVIATPGNSTDYDFIEQETYNLAEKYDIVEIPYDPYKAHEIVNHFQNAGFTTVPIRQNYTGMGPLTDAFEHGVLKGRINHGNNPVIRWMISCTELKSDRQDNRMPMKPQREKTGKRIDGTVASILAYGRAVIVEESAAFDVGAVYGKSS